MIALITIYVVLVAVTFIWSIGTAHAYEITKYDLLNNRPRWALTLFFSVFILPEVVPTLTVYYGHGWVWPKKGVTYDKHPQNTLVRD